MTEETSSIPYGKFRYHEEYKSARSAIKAVEKQVKDVERFLNEAILAPMKRAIESAKKELLDLENAYLQDMRGASAEFEEIRKRIQQQNESFAEIVSKLQARIAALQSPPMGRATFVRFLRMEKLKDKEFPLIEVRDANGKYASVFFLVENYDHRTLRYGQLVAMASVTGASHVVEVFAEFSVDGAHMRVVEALGVDREGPRFLVSGGEDNESSVIAHCAAGVDVSAIKAGTRVLADTTAGLIIETLPEKENEQFIVGEVPSVTFADIGGHDEMIRWIKDELTIPLLHPELYAQLGLRAPRGFVMHGPPGVGKTMTAKAIVNYMNELLSREHGESARGHFLHVRGPELQHWLVGRTEYTMRKIFEQARSIASPKSPVTIFFDEAESMFPVRGSGISSDVEKTNVTQFTALLDGLEERGNIIVILATNRFDLIDRAVTRPGRCDKVISVPRPDENAARVIFGFYLKPMEGQVHPKYLVPVYVPVDREGHPRTDEKGEEMRFKFESDPKNAVAYLVERTVRRMFDHGHSRNRFLRVRFAGEKNWIHYRYGDFVSGAMIANIIERAKKRSLKRHVESPQTEALGVELSDLFQSVEEVFSELRSPASLHEFNSWFQIEGHGGGKIVAEFAFTQATATLDGEN